MALSLHISNSRTKPARLGFLYNYKYSCTHKNIEEKSISVLQQSLSVEVRRSKATMIGHKGHKEAKTRLCTLNCRLYRYLLDCKVWLLACVHRALGKLGEYKGEYYLQDFGNLERPVHFLKSFG